MHFKYFTKFAHKLAATGVITGIFTMLVFGILIQNASAAIATVEFHAPNSAAAESQDAQIPVVFDQPLATTTNLNYEISSGTANPVEDYTESNSVTVPAGASAVNLEIDIYDDPAYEEDENFQVALQASTDLAVGEISQHTYTIIDNDPDRVPPPHDNFEQDWSQDEGQIAGASTEPEYEPLIVATSGPGEPTRLQLYNKHGEKIGPEITGLFPGHYLGGAGVTAIDADNDGVLNEALIYAWQDAGPQARVIKLHRDGNVSFLGQQFVFPPDWRGGLTAVADDFDNDGFVDDAAFAMTDDREPTVRVYKDIKGVDNWQLLSEFKVPFGKVGAQLGSFQYDDGAAEILVAPHHGPENPRVMIYDVRGDLKKEFLAYNNNIQSGVIASGIGERIYVTGKNAGPQVRVFDKNGQVKNSWWIYDKNLRGDFYNIAGDLDNDNNPEILTVPQGQHGPHIRAFKKDGRRIAIPDFFAFSEDARNGASVAVVKIEK
ncbi:Calx-beta domain-containing protein [Patescibacteria group bacterium]